MAAKKENNTAQSEKTAEESRKNIPAKAKDPFAERRPYTLYRPAGDKSDFDTVTINGRTYQIEYNKQVMLPVPVIEVLEESLKNRMSAEEAGYSASEAAMLKMSGI